MSPLSRPARFVRPSFAFLVLCILLGLAWLTGGASRADALGQIIMRTGAWLALIGLGLFGPRPILRQAGPVMWLLMGSLGLVLLQLVPLPLDLWQGLSGRDALQGTTQLAGQVPEWRPLSIVPGATLNAAASLVVPVAILIATLGIAERERTWLPAILLSLVLLCALIGLLQFSGAGFNNPFVNDAPGQVSGTFANRNHFALFMAIGCVLAPVWAFQEGRRPQWRAPVAVGLVLLFVLTILASGSRAGIIVGILGAVTGILVVGASLLRELRRYPRWVVLLLLLAVAGVIVGFVALSVSADRAESINRVVMDEGDEDMRMRALPILFALEKLYWPVGTGFGSFDPVFRMAEPGSLLKPTYFNHAHNDFLEIMLDGGLAGALLLAGAIGWWGWASFRAWLVGAGLARARAGSAILLLILVASLFDYPARTPMMMTVIMLAALWLNEGSKLSSRLALPFRGQQL